MSYNIGDMVIIHKDLTLSTIAWVSNMNYYNNRVATIERINKSSTGTLIYKLDIDSGRWAWDEHWLKPLPHKQKNKIRTNFEKYYEEIKSCIETGTHFGLCQGVLSPCNTIDCQNCGFSTGLTGKCSLKRMEWLCTEYRDIDNLILTTEEVDLLKVIPGKYKYITKDKSGDIYAHTVKPIKQLMCWTNSSNESGEFLPLTGFDVPFSFMHWYDKEPWEIDKLLELVE